MRIMDINLVVLAGKLAVDSEHRIFESGAHLLRLLVTVRCDEPRRRVDVVPVTLWEPTTDLTDGSLAAGRRVWITGTVQRRFWESAEGRRSRLEIVAHQVQCVDDVDNASATSR
jgi:single-stranded DNA-binding protein